MKFNVDSEGFSRSIFDKKNTVIYTKIRADILTPVLTFLKLTSVYKKYNFLFESVNSTESRSRYSIIGVDPDMIWRCENGVAFLEDRVNFSATKESAKHIENNPIASLRKFITNSQIEVDDEKIPSMFSGIFGYMSYDMIRLFEDIGNENLPDDIMVPDSVMLRPSATVIFDSVFDEIYVIKPIFVDNIQEDLSDEFVNKIYDDSVVYIKNLIKIISSNYEAKPTESNDKPNIGKLNQYYTKNEYCNIVTECKKYIADGDAFQILPSQRFSMDFNGNPFDFYRSLRIVNPSPFLFFLNFDDFSIIGSSPEILVSVNDGIVNIKPLAGTRPRGKDKEEDKSLMEELLSDAKELAEHLMLIDLARNDLGRVCEDGSIKLIKKMEVEYYSHVMHISSDVKGKLKKECDLIDALFSGFPAGTVSGAPKIRAMQIIEKLEKVKRSFYAGCVGYFSSKGDMTTCISLRTALIKNNKIYMQAAAGIVADSIPENEYQECINKLRALLAAIENMVNYSSDN